MKAQSVHLSANHAGKQAFAKKAYVEAAGYFQEATQAARESGEVLLAAEYANNWSVAALLAGDAETAHHASAGTPEIFLAGNQIQLAGMAYGNLAAALESLGDIEGALQNYERSAELLKTAGDYDQRLHVMQAMSALQLKSGDQLQALATMQAGLENSKRLNIKQRFLKKLLDYPLKLISGNK
jgi:tetratricopeptide (TPR) repeat protein